MRDRQVEIKNKGFNMLHGNPITKSEYEAQFGKDSVPEDFSKIRVGLKTLDDAVMNLGIYRKVNRNYGDKAFILNAIDKHDYEYLWMMNLLLEKSDWFKDNVKIWRYIDEEDGFIFEEEDLLEDE